jgi:5-methylcytosine-specific restriction endonuclease McrA
MNRTCKFCGTTYPLTRDNFGSTPSGFRHKCRRCVREYVRSYNAENSFRAAERTERRASTRLSASDRETYRARLTKRDGGFTCFYCKTKLDSTYQIDHKTPIARGGSHGFENFALA